MSEAKHTPGEWKPGFLADSPDEDHHTVWQYVESPSGHSVATVGCYQRKRVEFKSDDVKRISQEETDANVRLIAAAPDLLAACIVAMNDPSTPAKVWHVLFAAASKATGK